MAGLGMRDSDLADVLGIAEKTVQRRFKEEIKRGRAKARMQVLSTLYRMATGGKCPAATFFFAKCQLGWRETNHTAVAGDSPKGLAIE